MAKRLSRLNSVAYPLFLREFQSTNTTREKVVFPHQYFELREAVFDFPIPHKNGRPRVLKEQPNPEPSACLVRILRQEGDSSQDRAGEGNEKFCRHPTRSVLPAPGVTQE